MTRAREINQTRGRTSEASQHLDFQGFNQHQHLDDKKHHHCDHWSVKSFKIEAIFSRKNLFLAAVLALLDKTWRWVIFLLGCPDYHINIFLINIKLSFQNDFYRGKELKLSKHCRLKRPKHTWYLSIESARRLSMMT